MNNIVDFQAVVGNEAPHFHSQNSQLQQIKGLTTNLRENECVLQADFSESFNAKQQKDKVSLLGNNAISLHTSVTTTMEGTRN